jgi:beta-lactamase superfamily II metal-dependent hydrolase
MLSRLAVVFSLFLAFSTPLAAEDVRIHFLDVGQGDCTLVQCPDGINVMVDCGSIGGSDSAAARNYLLEQLGPNPKIDVLVITHPDQDHYNLLPTVLEGVEIGRVLLTDPNERYTVAKVNEWLDKIPAPKQILGADEFDAPDAPSELFGSEEVEFYVLAANIEGSLSPTNTRSIVLMVSFNSFDTILTGDATRNTESVILDRYEVDWLDTEVLKIGHHGSEATSTSSAWAEATKPEVATVSCGLDNKFAHPRKEVIERLQPFAFDLSEGHKFRWGFNPPGPDKVKFKDFDDFTDSIYTTAKNGTIVIKSNGTTFDVAFTDHTDTFEPGELLAHSMSVIEEAAEPEPAAAIASNERLGLDLRNLANSAGIVDLLDLPPGTGARSGERMLDIVVAMNERMDRLEVLFAESKKTDSDNTAEILKTVIASLVDLQKSEKPLLPPMNVQTEKDTSDCCHSLLLGIVIGLLLLIILVIWLNHRHTLLIVELTQRRSTNEYDRPHPNKPQA